VPLDEDVGETNHLNSLDSKINERGFFERILAERDKTEAEREKRLNERFASQEKAVMKAEQRLDDTLRGFPEEYARRIELEQLKESLQQASSILADKVVESASLLKESSDKDIDRINVRIHSLEAFQSKLLGLALAAPFVSALVVYLITR
jgi:ribosome-binding protein aMBF1 (putative translation factor)